MTESLQELQGAVAPAQEFEAAASQAFDQPAPSEPAEQTPAEPNAFAELGLAPELVAAVTDLGYTAPTAVQQKAIPMAMGGAEGAADRFVDLMVSSQTGSGKTAAFLLPVLHTLIRQQQEAYEAAQAEYTRLAAEAAERGEPAPKRPRRQDPTNPRHFKPAVPGALVLCPTRELAQQVAHDAIDLVRHVRGLRVANVVGGMPYQLQIARLQNANLVVATPGRLLDLQRSMQIKLDQVQFLVVDEADRMLDLGFSDDLAEINQLTIERKQTMMFSATFAPRIQQLAARVMREPQRVQIDSPQQKHANIKQILHWADHFDHKRALLDHWLRDSSIQQAVVFASTQIECDGLANDLQQAGFSAVALHGALSQGLRNRRLMALRNGQVQILVATDVAARGIDVPSISHVFNFGLPMKAEDYTHRIGRTGRAGRDGIAVTFAEFRDQRKIFDIEAFTKQVFKPEVVAGMEPTRRAPMAPQARGGQGGNRGGGRGREGGFGGGARRGGPVGGHGGRAAGWGEQGGAGRREGGGFDRDRREGFAGRREGFASQDPRGRMDAPWAGRDDRAPRGGERTERGAGWGEQRESRGGFGGGHKPHGANKGAAGHAGRAPAGRVFVPRNR
ncbi:DEAD/DEAH box helicase [Xenophilus arseniciresistens]|uniref:DEAD/DEAH box helicase n=1 Tax=Xenophilus arseniciresistens TaxID=1283306 RepID=A0AAE3NA78_9BURK|nr:DEAD/DEAH box helicase [Xenophilus arseniciresistens]MDA7417161.1 DEAD/DEAH box helicase [Xenophilus arseniciresistens]